MPIQSHLDLVDEKTRLQVMPMISYIQERYSAAVFDEKYSKKTHIPTWRHKGSYVAIGCRKKYISVYFGSPDAVQSIKAEVDSPYVVARKGCVNLCYKSKEIPYDAIFRGIDLCFGE